MKKPTKPADWIGKTNIIARALFHKAAKIKTTPDLEPIERCWILTGEPGTGKSSLAEAVAMELAGHPLDIDQINGQSCTAEKVRGWTVNGAYAPMFGGLRVQLVDEIDAASAAACNELRTYLDKLPRRTVFIATTNKRVSELQEQLQSRFKVQYFEHVATEVIARWLIANFEGLAPELAMKLAEGSGGNVRAAKADALSYLEVLEVA